jgi:hypothetical protein
MLVDHPLDSLFERWSPEVDEKSHLKVQEAQVRQHLFDVNWSEA